MGVATATREKASSRNVRGGTYLTDGECLYEVVGIRGFKVLRVGDREVPAIEEVCLADAALDLPYGLREDLRRGAWMPFEEVLDFEVVVPADSAD